MPAANDPGLLADIGPGGFKRGDWADGVVRRGFTKCKDIPLWLLSASETSISSPSPEAVSIAPSGQDIAENIGYESDTAFSSSFKRMFGCSPGSYRTQMSRAAL